MCGQDKDSEGFYADNSRKSGIGKRCIACDKIYKKASKNKRAKYFSEYRKKNKKRLQAKWKAGYAVKTGKIKRHPCEICGAYAEIHHADYDKPLQIKWLCHKHHMQHHNGWGLLK